PAPNVTVYVPDTHVLGSVTLAALTVAPPVLAAPAVPWTSEAAAICAGLVSATEKPPAAAAVGWIRKLSPLAGVPLVTMLSPAAWKGLPLVPLPVIVTGCPVVTSVSCHAPPENCSL